jgi:hypothetical protein
MFGGGGILFLMIFFVLIFAIGLALLGLGLVIGFGGASIPFIAIGLSQKEDVRIEKAKEYVDVPVGDGRKDWHLKLREMHLGAQSETPSEALDPDHSPQILD